MNIESQLKRPPFLIAPRFVERVWGFDDLRPWFAHEPDGRPIGEVWLNGDECLAASGPYAGMSLAEIFSKYPLELLGSATRSPQSPLLIKLIFAKEKLSVQVHPDDTMARKYGAPRGKTECWAVLESGPDAKVAVGLKAGVTVADVERGIKEQTLESMLEILPVDKGEMIYVDAGTVHAILPGAVLLEVQQNCDLTYRLYDYGRPRELHVEKGLEALRLKTRAGKVAPAELGDRTLLINTNYFRIERMELTGSAGKGTLVGEDDGRLTYIYVASGAGLLKCAGETPLELKAQSMVLVPARASEYTIECAEKIEIYRIIDTDHEGGNP